MIGLKDIIEQCLKSCNPPVRVYSEDGEGNYYMIRHGVVADVESATEHLQSVLNPYLKNEEEQDEIIKLKSEIAYLKGEISAYEKFLKRNGIITDVEDNEIEILEPTYTTIEEKAKLKEKE